MDTDKRLAALFCISAMVLCFTLCSSETVSPTEKEANKTKAFELRKQILDTMAITYYERAVPLYPESYGDCYINDDGNLVICIVDNEYADEFCATLPKNVETKLVKYSLNQLVEFRAYLFDIGWNTIRPNSFRSIKQKTSINKVGLDVRSEDAKEYYESRIAAEHPEYMDAYYIRVFPYEKRGYGR